MANYNPCFSERDVFRRRLAVFGLMAISTVLASMKWITVLPTDVSIFTKLLLILDPAPQQKSSGHNLACPQCPA